MDDRSGTVRARFQMARDPRAGDREGQVARSLEIGGSRSICPAWVQRRGDPDGREMAVEVGAFQYGGLAATRAPKAFISTEETVVRKLFGVLSLPVQQQPDRK